MEHFQPLVEAEQRPGEDARRLNSVQSVERTLDLFELLVNADGDLGMRELSEQSRFPVATVHRLLRVLVRRGYARQAGNRRYGLGPTALELVSRIRTQGGLRQLAQPYLRELVRLTNESANLGVLDGSQAIYLAQVEAPRMMRLFTEPGNRVPFHACAIGKALVAWLPDNQREATFAQAKLTRHTPATITEREQLRLELAKVRAQGYALDEGEYEEGVRCVSVPVFDARGYASAALSVSGPTGRVTREHLDVWIPRMKAMATDLSRAMASGQP